MTAGEEREEAARTQLLTLLQTQLSEATDRARRLEEELDAYRARRSVRAADTLARVRATWRRHRSPADRPRADGGNTARWAHRYAGVDAPQPYGDSVTYRVGAEFLADCGSVEDWGCGLGWLRNFVPADRYVGVDGSASRFADRVVDLETYRSDADGIFMRHVLEHNYRWERILDNALASFRHRFVLVTFTPYGETTREIAFNDDPGVPDLSFAKGDLTRHLAGLGWREETYVTDTQYGTETVYLVERPPQPPGGRPGSSRRGSHPASRTDTPGTLRISAVVPCFNGAEYLEEALSSITCQARPVHEIIVVDDGSDDGSAELAERCGATVLRHGRNRGEGAARNTGWRAATGDAIAWLDADDSWRPHHTEVVGALLERSPGAACAFGGVQRFGLDDQLILGAVPVDEPGDVVRDAFWSWIHACIGCIVRRAALEAIDGYDERGRISVDFDLWLRLARRNRFVATHEVTANWRWHEGQQSADPLAQILAVHRYRRRFVKTLRAEGEHALADELEPMLRPAWTAHLDGVQAMVEQRRQRTAASLGGDPDGPTLADRAMWAVLPRLHPSTVDLVWRLSGRA